MRNTQWARLLASVTGMVNQRLLMQNEYLTGPSTGSYDLTCRRDSGCQIPERSRRVKKLNRLRTLSGL